MFTPKLEYDQNASIDTNLRAIINWLNFALQEIAVGRVPNNKEQTDREIDVLESQLVYTAMMTDTLVEEEEEDVQEDQEVV